MCSSDLFVPEANQLALVPLITDQLAAKESKLLEALAVIRYLEEQIRTANKTKNVIIDVPDQAGIINRQDGENITSGSNSSGGFNKDGLGNGGFTPHCASTLDESRVGNGKCDANCDGGLKSSNFKIFQYRINER